MNSLHHKRTGRRSLCALAAPALAVAGLSGSGVAVSGSGHDAGLEAPDAPGTRHGPTVRSTEAENEIEGMANGVGRDSRETHQALWQTNK